MEIQNTSFFLFCISNDTITFKTFELNKRIGVGEI